MQFEWVQLEYIFRVLLAGICGIVVGWERKNRSKEAGIRTHFVVACGAALIMIISKYAFFDVIGNELYNGADVRLDPSRVASTIASGIGFLGAGMIFVHRNTISGLTTAAGIWAISGVGMAIGAGMYVVGIAVTVLILLAQLLLHLHLFKTERARVKVLSVKEVADGVYQQRMTELLSAKEIAVLDVSVEKLEDGGIRNYSFTLELPDGITEEEIIDLVPYRCSIKPCL
ncbi:MAG: MgtC/SapB family protein [Ruminococcaceae bacterium]|nr:MgtC/SapB family protein [Oscillospiraceae bacterium]